MGRTACTEPQCLYKGALYLYLTVELYVYSPYGPYGLYRASVPVQGCTLPLPYSRAIPLLPLSRAIPLLPLWAVRPVQNLSACTRVHFTFTLQESYMPTPPLGLTASTEPQCLYKVAIYVTIPGLHFTILLLIWLGRCLCTALCLGL
jgi:hypothetical protein